MCQSILLPIDMTLLRRFAKSPSHQSGEAMYEFMQMVGDDLLTHLHTARERIAFAAAHVERWSIPHAGETIEALFLPRTDPGSDEPSTAVGNYIRSEGLGEVIQVIVYPDRRRLVNEPEVRLQIVLRKQVGKLIGALKKIPVPSVAPAGGANPGGINSGGKALRFSSTGPGSSQNLAFTGSMSASG